MIGRPIPAIVFWHQLAAELRTIRSNYCVDLYEDGLEGAWASTKTFCQSSMVEVTALC
jgi:hypothetical protein